MIHLFQLANETLRSNTVANTNVSGPGSGSGKSKNLKMILAIKRTRSKPIRTGRKKILLIGKNIVPIIRGMLSVIDFSPGIG
ncbi:MAG: hypothetical protein ABR533_08520 [Desulfonatronovibrio sp.]